MDNLLKQQEETRALIVQIERNYRKDGENRKTKTYLESRLASLRSLYTKYISTDDEIINSVRPLESSHPYLNTRKEICGTYNSLIEEMRQRLHNGPPLTPIPPTMSDVESIQPASIQWEQSTYKCNPPPPLKAEGRKNNIMKRQDVLMRQMYQKLASFAHALETKNYSTEFLNLKVAQLEKDREEISTIHTTILVETEEGEEQASDYFKEDYHGTLQNKIDATIIQLLQQKNSVRESAETTQIQLPKVEIPTFCGEYGQWSAFYEIFTELIHHNRSLSNTVKMTYLKSHLAKGAAQLISHLPTTGDNYGMAWSTVKARFNNPRLLANNYFNTILSLANLQVSSAQAVRTMHDTAKEMMHNIQRLNMSSAFEAFVVFILSKKLDPESIRLYETTLENPREVPEAEYFFNFLERRFRSLEAMGSNNRPIMTQPFKSLEGNNRPTTARSPFVPQLRRVHAATIATICWMDGCKERHDLAKCGRFRKMSTLDRSRLVNKLNLCVRCMTKHEGNHCKIWCIVCNGLHNTMLHCNNTASKSEGTAKTLLVNQQSPVLLPTAWVTATTGSGQITTLRALIDVGSQATLISSRAAKLFNFKKKRTYIKISGVGGTEAGICRYTVNTTISSRFTGDFKLNIEAMVLDGLDQKLPEREVDSSKWDHLKKLELADPHYNRSQPIDLIIGADYYPAIVINNLVKGRSEDPMAQQTEFGWIVIGNLGKRECQEKITMIATKAIEDQLKLLIENDSIPEERS